MIIEHLGLNRDFINKYKELYNKYGEAMMKLEGIDNDRLMPMNTFKHISESDNIANASVDSSANVSSKTIGVIQSESVKPLWKIFSHNKIYSELNEKYGKQVADEWFENQVNGALYLHDSTSASFLPYCYSFSLKKVHEKGLFFINEMKGHPAKHLSTWVNHVCEFIGYSANQLSGAVAIPDVLLYMYKYWLDDIASGHVEKERAEEYKNQQFQAFIYRINQPITRDGVQSAYTNLQILDMPHLMEFFGGDTFNDGSLMLDYFEGFLEFQKDFLKYERELRKIKFFTFPVLTASLKIDENKEYEDEYVAKYVVEHNMEFQDVNIYNATEISGLSSCCRLVNDTKEIVKGKEKLEGFFSSIGGTSISIGSIKVNTINFARISYEAQGDLNRFYEILKNRVELTHKVLDVHRDIIKKNVKRGLLPIYTHGLMDMDKQFGTVGINGLYECIDFLGGIDRNDLGESSYNDLGHSITMNIFKIIKELNAETLEKYGFTSNTEQVPAESASTKGVSKDRLLFREQVKDTTLYGNQWIPLSVNTSINNRIEASANYDTQCGGGAILHLNLGEPLKDFNLAWELTKSIAKRNVVYYSLINKFQYCEQDHSFYGKTCPICNGEAIGNAIKIVGYIVKDEHFEKTRKNELDSRIFYKI